MSRATRNPPTYARYIGIDYSGAEVPTASLAGLRVYRANGNAPPVEVMPPPSPRKYWTRKGIAHWLAESRLKEAQTLIGIDHGLVDSGSKCRGSLVQANLIWTFLPSPLKKAWIGVR